VAGAGFSFALSEHPSADDSAPKAVQADTTARPPLEPGSKGFMLKRCDHRVDPQFSRKFLKLVVDADVVLTVAQVRVVRRRRRPAVVDHTDDGYIEWTVLTVHE
jgi:hypothetical protein